MNAPQAQGALIELVGVQKSYDGQHLVIPGLDLSVRRGEFLTLLGASGSGKTTTLMMLAGFETPTAGHILMNGRPIEDVPPHRRGIGMVFQNYALFPHMTVMQNLAYPLRMRGLKGAALQAKVDRAIELVQLEGMAQRRPAQLSGGQQQRVALARALVFEPELVLMDEPLGALDKNLREHMQYEIKRIHQQLGVTVVYVTHDQGEALTMSDRVAVFHEGRVEQLAPPAMLYDTPATDYIAGFIGENNALEGEVRSAGPQQALLQLPGSAPIPLPRPVASARARVRVRPERVHVGAGDIRLAATVSDLVYLGDHTRLVARLPGGATLVAKLGPGQLPADAGIGAGVTLGWRAADMTVFPARS
ncbi:MAG: ABC transporter ATP-binding protein [Aquincola tertiaricarbonis]|uniref:ABC transporter ATP-binding protein n=1 Tax=Aquincola tertiaricarbonis TaxID=391953 RepID=UPI000614F46C|nr:ABC transporter ATP-binding protein [Aquincola tertiaricarbonis]